MENQTKNNTNNFHIVDFDGLAEFLKSNKYTLRKIWRDFPHVYIGIGKDLRGARFDVDDVLIYLKQSGENYGSLEKQNKRLLGCKISTQNKAIQTRRTQDQERSCFVGSPKTPGTECGSNYGDPFGLLSGIGNHISK